MKNPLLVLLGLDAGDPELIRRWAEDGYLPTIASLIKRGCWGRTAGPELISEHGVWPCLFSGVSRAAHGYYYFRQLRPGTYDLEPVTGRDFDIRPFWHTFRERQKKVAAIDVPDAGLMKGLPGVQLSDWAAHQGWGPGRAPASEPPGLLRELGRLFGPPIPIEEESSGSPRKDRRIYRCLMERIERKGELCRHLLGREDFDLAVVVFSESHDAGHQFWEYREQAREDGRAAAGSDLSHAIRDIYHAIDAQMGSLIARLPAGANVFVLSSVGMEDDYPTEALTEAFCRRLGYQAAAECAPVELRVVDWLRRSLPQRWRTALGTRLPHATRERLLRDRFRQGANWSKTTAFAIPSIYTSFLRVNLRGREPQGTVAPGAAYEALLDRLENDLGQLVDESTGKPAIKRVVRTMNEFGGGLPVGLPDLFVEWSHERFMRRVLHPGAELIQQAPGFFRPSDHSGHGFVAAAGPSIGARGRLDDVSLLDLAPTFLALMGEPIPQALTGQPIRAMTTG